MEPAALKRQLGMRVQTIVSQVNDAFAKDPSIAGRVVPNSEVMNVWGGAGFRRNERAGAAAMTDNAFQVMYGRVVEGLAAERVAADPCLSAHLVHLTRGEQARKGDNPDFRGVGRAEGLNIDVTTDNEAKRKPKAQPGKSQWTFATYQRRLRVDPASGMAVPIR